MVFLRGESLGNFVAGACARIFDSAFVASFSAAARRKRNAASDQGVRRKRNGKNNLTKRAEKIPSRKNAEENCAAKNEEKGMTKRENFGNKSGEKRNNQKRSGLAGRKERELRKEKKPTVA